MRWSPRLLARAGSLVVALALAVGVQGVTPVHASVSNPILGPFEPTNLQSNPYAACIATTLVGNGFTFGSVSILGADLGTLWPNIPSSIAGICNQAVDSRAPQVCIVPT